MAKEQELLPASERVRILTNRVANIKGGSGDFPSEYHRQWAIALAENALKDAQSDLLNETAA